MADVAKDNKTLLDSLPNSAKLELSKWPKPNLSPVRIVKEELKMHKWPKSQVAYIVKEELKEVPCPAVPSGWSSGAI